MFNPTPQRAAPQAWAPNPVIQPPPKGEVGFATTDWVNVPRVDYRTEKFRQLAVPDPARVVDDAHDFEPWKPQQLGSNPGPDAAQADQPDRAADTDVSRRDNTASHEAPSQTAGANDTADAARPDQSADSAVGEEASATSADTGAESAALEEPDAGASADASADASPDAPESTLSDEASAANAEAGDADPAAQSAAPQQDEGAVAADSQPIPAEPSLDSAAVQEACDTARREGLEQGQEEGRTLGREEAQAQAQEALKAALEQAEAEKAQALQQLREELEGEIEPLKRQLNKTAEQVESLVGQPDKLYEHVKRLSLHLAEQLVLGELNMSSAAIERLIQRCLDELDLHGNHVVTVELNPQDKARLQERAGELSHSLSLQAVSSLQPGSVRVMINDTMVEDLVGNRLEALARSLLVQPEVWREQSPFFRQPLAQRDTDIQDAPARVVAPRETTPVAAQAPEAPAPIHLEDDVPSEDAEHLDTLETFEVTPPSDRAEPVDHPGEPHD